MEGKRDGRKAGEIEGKQEENEKTDNCKHAKAAWEFMRKAA